MEVRALEYEDIDNLRPLLKKSIEAEEKYNGLNINGEVELQINILKNEYINTSDNFLGVFEGKEIKAYCLFMIVENILQIYCFSYNSLKASIALHNFIEQKAKENKCSEIRARTGCLDDKFLNLLRRLNYIPQNVELRKEIK